MLSNRWPVHRTNTWLTDHLYSVWRAHFPDVEPSDRVHIQFGRRCRTRLGSIRERDGESLIRINGVFRSPEIPAFVVRATVAHELAHYAHGFGSSRPRLHRYPHRGRVVHRELKARGLEDLAVEAKRWLDRHWRRFWP